MAVACLGFGTVGAEAPAREQAIVMERGWNLVSLQVGPGWEPSALASMVRPVGVGSTNPVVSIWGIASGAPEWRSFQPRVPNFPHDLQRIDPGKGYWIQVDGPASLNVTGPAWEGPLNLAPGWNLIGLPGLATDDAGLSMESAFRTNLVDIQQAWGWDSTPSRQRYVGFDTTARPVLKELQALLPGKGYWIYNGTSRALSLSPKPEIALLPDIDVPPLSDGPVRAVGPEDAANDLNGNEILDTAFTQDTLLFSPGIQTAVVTIQNAGLGRINWSARIPSDGLAGKSFVSFRMQDPQVDSASIKPDLISIQSGRLLSPGTDALDGVVASIPGHLTVQVDRSALTTGRHTNAFTIWAGDMERVVRVIVEVPPVDGDWSGFAVARTVNGRDVALGKIDLYLAMQRQNGARNPADPALRAIISRDRSLLFPRDVALSGAYFTEREFYLNTRFEVPRGDRNAPPYSTFKTDADDQSKGRGYGDYDANGDGRLDNSNPFPFPIRREITLLGTNVNENRMVGRYVESFQNLLPERRLITVEGEFELERRSILPSLTSVFNRSVNTNAMIGGGGFFSLTNRLTVTNEFVIEGVRGAVRLEFGGGVRPELLLYGPGTHGTQPVSIPLTATNGITGQIPFAFTNFNGLPGWGEWQLVVRWASGSERGTFTGWDLQLQGTATFSIAGRVLDGGAPGTALADALVVLSGNGKAAQRMTGPDGRFRFDGLTENGFAVFISRPGYSTLRRDVDLFTQSVDLGDLSLSPVPVVASELRALPAVGAQPFFTRLTPLLAADALAGLGILREIRWDFGDGRRQTNALSAGLPAGVPVEYSAPGSYRVTATIVGTSSNPVVLERWLAVLPISVMGRGTNWVFAATIGSGASGAGNPASVVVTNRIVSGGLTNEFRTARRGTNLLESVRDPASFDYARYNARFLAAGESPVRFPHPVDTDVFPVRFAALGTNGVWSAVNASGGGDSALTPPATLPRHRFAVTLGGFVHGTAPARVGAIITNTVGTSYRSLELQAGRIDP